VDLKAGQIVTVEWRKDPNASPLDNVAQIVSLQGLLGNQPTTPVPNSFLNDDWLDDDFSF
jgi:hypothetical protein